MCQRGNLLALPKFALALAVEGTKKRKIASGRRPRRKRKDHKRCSESLPLDWRKMRNLDCFSWANHGFCKALAVNIIPWTKRYDLRKQLNMFPTLTIMYVQCTLCLTPYFTFSSLIVLQNG